MTVYFSNAGLIDLDVIRIMGVSVKTKENPIGYFGTGLKFAISTLLRTSHSVKLIRDGEEIEFTVKDADVRGQKVQRVFMGDEALPFTTELGRNWEVWQAYRELHSNTLDEAGVITDKAVDADTVFVVEGSAIQREFENRDQIFVSGEPIAANAFIEVYPGPSNYVYYRGVRAGALPKELSFRYNILMSMELSEDRLFRSQFDVEWKLQTLLPKIAHRGVHAELLSGTERWDQNLSFDNCSSPSKEFLDAAEANYSNLSAPHAARTSVDRDKQRSGEFKPAKMNDDQHRALLAAFPHLLKLGSSLSPEDIEIVESLGPNTMGVYHIGKDQIFLAVSTLDCGLETVVATLYEEWLHKAHKYTDMSRQLQTFLFQRLVAVSMGVEPPEPVEQKTQELPF